MSSTVINPLIPPLQDNQFLVDLVAEITGAPSQEVRRRFEQEDADLGSNVRHALTAAGIEPYVWSDKMAQFYADTDAFLYETLIWNRTRLKNEMRGWIGKYLAELSDQPMRVLSFGDGLGIDAYYLAQLGHQVTYFEISEPCITFARRIFEQGGLAVSMLDKPDQLPDQYFDVVVCLDVLEHVPDPPQLVSWLAKSLRDKGKLLIHAPFFYIHPSVTTHLRSNGRYSGDLKSLYEANGLRAVAGRLFWDPIVVESAVTSSTVGHQMPWPLRLGGAILKSSRYWAAPHIAVGKFLAKKKLHEMKQ